MKSKFFKLLTFCLVLSVTVPVSLAQTKEGLHLGKFQFIQAPTNISIEQRTLKMTMSRQGVTPRFAARVGGVAFVQQAEPNFPVKSFSLECNKSANSAYAIINGQKYDIPLPVWQLEPIVNYANDTNNAAVTLFGEEKCQILFHRAFLDRLLGLRLLQTDLLLMLDSEECGLLVEDQNNVPIIGQSELSSYNNDSILHLSKIANEKLKHIVDSMGSYNSYIYTDLGERITFSIEDNKLEISGVPYYRFTQRGEIDTLETYMEILSFLETFEMEKKRFKFSDVSEAYSDASNPTICAIKKIVESDKSDIQKAQEVLSISGYYEFQDFINYLKKDSTAGRRLCRNVEREGTLSDEDIEYFKKAMEKTTLSKKKIYKVISVFNQNPWDIGEIIIDINKRQRDLITKYIKIMNENSIYNVPALVEYKYQIIRAATDPKVNSYANPYRRISPGNDELLIYYIFTKGVFEPVLLSDMTDYFKDNSDMVNDLNPVVIDAAVATCQWAAFFRYAKTKNPDNWKSFVKQVKSLQYDAPKVYTPIRIKP